MQYLEKIDFFFLYIFPQGYMDKLYESIENLAGSVPDQLYKETLEAFSIIWKKWNKGLYPMKDIRILEKNLTANFDQINDADVSMIKEGFKQAWKSPPVGWKSDKLQWI